MPFWRWPSRRPNEQTRPNPLAPLSDARRGVVCSVGDDGTRQTPGVGVRPPQASHGEPIAAAVFAAWDRARAPTFQKIDKLDDAAIALLDAGLSPDLKAAAQRDAKSIAELAVQFGFEKGAQIARDLAERFSGESLTPIDGVAISEQLLGLRESL